MVFGPTAYWLKHCMDCGLKGPVFQSHLQQRFTSLPGALSPTPKIESRGFTFVSFGGDIKSSVLGNPLKLGVSSLTGSFPVNQLTKITPQVERKKGMKVEKSHKIACVCPMF